MVTIEENTPEKLVVVAKPRPRRFTGLAYIFLGGLFLYVGVSEHRPLSLILGLVSLGFAWFTLRSRTRTILTFDKAKGDLVLDKRTATNSGVMTHLLSEVQSVEVRAAKVLWRTIRYLNLTLMGDRQLAIQHSMDFYAADQEQAAEQIRAFLGLKK